MTGNAGAFNAGQTGLAWIVVLTVLYLSRAFAGSPMFDEALEAYSAGDIATAYELWRPLAEHGDVEAQFALGMLYYDGIGVPLDHTESSYWFLQAAEQGFAPAQYNLGNAYKRGEGVRQNDAMAVYWWQKAAAQGLKDAQYNLDTAHREGVGVATDEQPAVRLKRQASGKARPPAADITGNPVAAAAAGECENWLGSQPPEAYTIQLMSTTRLADAHDLARQYDLPGYVVCRYAHKGHTRHALLFGTYPDADAAGDAVANLPPGLRADRPWIRKIKGLRQAVTDRPSGQ